MRDVMCKRRGIGRIKSRARAHKSQLSNRYFCGMTGRRVCPYVPFDDESEIELFLLPLSTPLLDGGDFYLIPAPQVRPPPPPSLSSPICLKREEMTRWIFGGVAYMYSRGKFLKRWPLVRVSPSIPRPAPISQGPLSVVRVYASL